jgi:hypothetical protein
VTFTGAWGRAVADLPSNGFTHTHTLTLEAAGQDTTWPLTPLQSQVQFDNRRAPRITAQLVIGWPPLGVRDLLDPKRYQLTVRIDAGYIIGTGSRRDVARVATLRVITAAKDHVAQTVTLTLASDEAIPIGHAAEVAYAYTTSSSILTSIKAVIADSFPADVLTWVTDGVEDDVFSAAQRIEVGEDRWEAVDDWADMLGAKVYHDGLGHWVIGPRVDTPSGGVSVALRTGPGGQVSALTVVDTLEGYANRVALVYEAKSATSAATINTSGAVASTGQLPPRSVTVTRKRKPDKPAQAARRALRRGLRRGHIVRTTATAFYWVRPDAAVTILTPDRQERLTVQQVTFQLDRGTMTLEGQSPAPGALDSITVTTFA